MSQDISGVTALVAGVQWVHRQSPSAAIAQQRVVTVREQEGNGQQAAAAAATAGEHMRPHACSSAHAWRLKGLSISFCAAKTHVVALRMPLLISFCVLRFIHIILAHSVLWTLPPSPGRPTATPPGFRHWAPQLRRLNWGSNRRATTTDDNECTI